MSAARTHTEDAQLRKKTTAADLSVANKKANREVEGICGNPRRRCCLLYISSRNRGILWVAERGAAEGVGAARGGVGVYGLVCGWYWHREW